MLQELGATHTVLQVYTEYNKVLQELGATHTVLQVYTEYNKVLQELGATHTVLQAYTEYNKVLQELGATHTVLQVYTLLCWSWDETVMVGHKEFLHHSLHHVIQSCPEFLCSCPT